MRMLYAKGLLMLLLVGAGLAVWPSLRSLQRTHILKTDESMRREVKPLPNSLSAAAALVTTAVQASITELPMGEQDRLKAEFRTAMALELLAEQEAAFDQFLNVMTPTMIAALLDGLKSHELRSGAVQLFFDHWASESPRDAIAWAQTQADPASRRSFLTVAAVRWVGIDLYEAAEWARCLPPGQGRLWIMEAVGHEAVRLDPFEALLIGLELTVGSSEQNRLIGRAAAEWAYWDPHDAIDWIGTIEDVVLRQRMTEHVAVASADKEPLAAATLALSQMPPSLAKDRTIVSIVTQWVQSDPTGAAAWVGRLPESPLGRDAVESLINLWADRDLLAAGNWLLKLDSDQMQSAGFDAYERVLAR